jgi:DNA-binding transcriptional regulator YhcF (GntR family)
MELRLGELQLKIFRNLSSREYKNIAGLAKELNKSLTRVSIALKDLESKGFVETKKYGISKEMVLSDNKHSLLLKTFISEHYHMKFEKTLSGSTLEVLLPIACSKVKFQGIVMLSGCSSATVKRTIKKLREFGIVALDKEFYYFISLHHKLLSDFVKEFQSYINLKLALSFSNTSVILWQGGKEFLIKTGEERKKDNFFPTCYERMSGYGIKLLLTNFRYYFYSPFRRNIRMEDAVLHTLVLDTSDARNILYVLMLIAKNVKKIRWNYLDKESGKFGLESVIKNIKDYVKNKGKPKPEFFPSWNEFTEKAEEYDICLK